MKMKIKERKGKSQNMNERLKYSKIYSFQGRNYHIKGKNIAFYDWREPIWRYEGGKLPSSREIWKKWKGEENLPEDWKYISLPFGKFNGRVLFINFTWYRLILLIWSYFNWVAVSWL